MEESPLANPPANPPPSRTHTHSAWHPTWGLLSLSTLPAWGGPPLGDPQSPPHLSFQTAVLVGTPVACPGLGPGCHRNSHKSGGGGGCRKWVCGMSGRGVCP